MDTAHQNFRTDPTNQPGKLVEQTITGLHAPWYDFLIISLGAILLAVLVLNDWQVPIQSPLRIILGLLYTFFVPGYSFLAALFPKHDQVSNSARSALSIGLSITFIVMTSLVFDQNLVRLHIDSMLVALYSVIFTCMALALIQRALLPQSQEQQSEPAFAPNLWWQRRSLYEKRIYLLIGSAALVALLSISWLLRLPSAQAYSTEFYILGESKIAEDFPRTVITGQEVSSIIGVTNKEREEHIFRIEVHTTGLLEQLQIDQLQKVYESEPFTLQPNETIELPISWKVPEASKSWSTQEHQVEFLLFLDDRNSPKGEPYRQLRLWLDVAPE